MDSHNDYNQCQQHLLVSTTSDTRPPQLNRTVCGSRCGCGLRASANDGGGNRDNGQNRHICERTISLGLEIDDLRSRAQRSREGGAHEAAVQRERRIPVGSARECVVHTPTGRILYDEKGFHHDNRIDGADSAPPKRFQYWECEESALRPGGRRRRAYCREVLRQMGAEFEQDQQSTFMERGLYLQEQVYANTQEAFGAGSDLLPQYPEQIADEDLEDNAQAGQ